MGAGTLGLELSSRRRAPTRSSLRWEAGVLIADRAWFTDRISVVGVEPELAPTLTAGRSRRESRWNAPAGGIAARLLAPRRVGEAGRHARFAVGIASLPAGVAVEVAAVLRPPIETIFSP